MENSLNHAISADYADPIKQLLTIGPPSGFDPADWPDYAMAFGLGREHSAALIHLACDAALHCGDTDRDEAWAPMHALRVLGQLEAEESVAPILAFLRAAGENEVAYEEFPAVLSLIGPAAIPTIAEFLAGPSDTTSPVIRVMEGLTKIALGHPECRSECIDILTQLLKREADTDGSVNGFAIWDLVDLAAVEAMDTIRDAFRRKSVDLSIAGDEEDVEIALGLRMRRSTPRPDFRIAPSDWVEDLDDVLWGTNMPHRTFKVGRNAPCPCGSGKKYKKCCLS
jgi:SEC-C motif